MKITLTQTLDQFFNRCIHNIQNETKNQFLGMSVTKENELNVQYLLRKAKFNEFIGPKENWPSLFISSEAYQNSPYNRSIKLDVIKSSEFTYKTERINSNELFSLSSIVYDPNRELNDSMRLVALDEPYEAAFLYQNDKVWMLDAPSEAETINPYASKAFGNVLTFGLGIGYFPFMAMLNSKVKSITVIEKSRAVIDMFNTYIKPQFPTKIPFKIIEGDAFDYFNETELEKYDYCFIDVWQSNDDGLVIIEKLLENYLPPFEKVDFWIESSCFEVMPSLILLYFEALSRNKSFRTEDKVYQRLVRKIEKFFKTIDQIIDDENKLKDYMYDTKLHRLIVSIKL
ncbi:MAG: hypothetical protein Q8T08_20155 [Ignavibacteria bacterium]|nr:hypothetical protein [Ignavibacteria bacterium]